MKKQVLYICIFMSFLLLTACSFNKISSSSEYEVEQEERSWLEGDAGRLTGYYKDYYLSFCENENK